MSNIIVSYLINSVKSSGAGLLSITFTLTSADANMSSQYLQNVPTVILEQGVTYEMSAQERQEQVNGTFLTLMKPIFELFALHAETSIGTTGAVTDLGYGAAVGINVHPIVGLQGQVVI